MLITQSTFYIIRHTGPVVHATSSTSQSGEASTSAGHPLEPHPFSSHGPVGSVTSSKDPENALQKAYEKAIRSQIEVMRVFLNNLF
jgi:E3 ubiquitin-protein ligase synoviolin